MLLACLVEKCVSDEFCPFEGLGMILAVKSFSVEPLDPETWLSSACVKEPLLTPVMGLLKFAI